VALGAGKYSLNRPDLSAESGEVRDGRWHTLKPLGNSIAVPEGLAGDVVVLSATNTLDSARDSAGIAACGLTVVRDSSGAALRRVERAEREVPQTGAAGIEVSGLVPGSLRNTWTGATALSPDTPPEQWCGLELRYTPAVVVLRDIEGFGHVALRRQRGQLPSASSAHLLMVFLDAGIVPLILWSALSNLEMSLGRSRRLH